MIFWLPPFFNWAFLDGKKCHYIQIWSGNRNYLWVENAFEIYRQIVISDHRFWPGILKIDSQMIWFTLVNCLKTCFSLLMGKCDLIYYWQIPLRTNLCHVFTTDKIMTLNMLIYNHRITFRSIFWPDLILSDYITWFNTFWLNLNLI